MASAEGVSGNNSQAGNKNGTDTGSYFGNGSHFQRSLDGWITTYYVLIAVIAGRLANAGWRSALNKCIA